MLKGLPIVICVGGKDTGKTTFIKEFTHQEHSHPTRESLCFLSSRGIALTDTPGTPEYRTNYSWTGLFGHVDCIVNFGQWSPSEIKGTAPLYEPIYVTWSGDNEETMNRILQVLHK